MFKEKPYHPSNAYFIKHVVPKPSGLHGLGVFATAPIKKREIFEVSPVLLYTPAMFNLFHNETEHRHIQESYVFWWENGKVATSWGYGSLYNHSNDNANAGYRLRRTEFPAIEIYATKDIEVGEEVCIHYMHHKFDIEFGANGEWWNVDESDMTSAIGGFDDSTAKLMSDKKRKEKSDKDNLF